MTLEEVIAEKHGITFGNRLRVGLGLCGCIRDYPETKKAPEMCEIYIKYLMGIYTGDEYSKMRNHTPHASLCSDCFRQEYREEYNENVSLIIPKILTDGRRSNDQKSDDYENCGSLQV